VLIVYDNEDVREIIRSMLLRLQVAKLDGSYFRLQRFDEVK
jgi:hypothetical protein